jgi:hypothetical protein
LSISILKYSISFYIIKRKNKSLHLPMSASGYINMGLLKNSKTYIFGASHIKWLFSPADILGSDRLKSGY